MLSNPYTLSETTLTISNQSNYAALQSNGLKIMVLLRLSPLIPYNALDYMSGITAIPLWSYAVALIGLLPGTVSLCIVGASASSLTDASSSENLTLKIVTIVLGVVFAASGVFLVSYYSQRELERVSVARCLVNMHDSITFIHRHRSIYFQST